MKQYTALFFVALFSSAVSAECFDNFATSYKDRFIIHSNGSLTDRLTGLMWMRCHLGHRWDAQSNTCSTDRGNQKFTWEEALQNAKVIRDGGIPTDQDMQPVGDFTDWRVPNIKEITSLIQRNCSTESNYRIDDSIFVKPAGIYWSATPALGTQKVVVDGVDTWENGAWVADFTYLQRADVNAMSMKHAVRLVRNAVNNLGAN